jgi:hypothetical protein
MITAGEHPSRGTAPEHDGSNDIRYDYASSGVADAVAVAEVADSSGFPGLPDPPERAEVAELVRASYGRQFGVALDPSYARAFADLPLPPDEVAQLIHALVLLARHAVQITNARAKQTPVGTPKHPAAAAAHR